MAVTVGDLIELAFPSGTEVVAGRTGLNREVVWARTLRPRPPAFEPLEGKELAILSSSNLSLLGESMTLSYVLNRLASVEVSAVAVQGAIDEGAIEAADHLGVPLIQLPPDVSLSDIERSAIATIVDRQAELQRRAADIHRQLAQLTFEERGLQAVVDRMAEICGKTVAVEDDQFRLQFFSSTPPDLGLEDLPLRAARKEIEQWVRTTVLSITQPPMALFNIEGTDLARFVSPIPARDGVAGYFAIIGPKNELTELDRLAAGRGAAVCAVEVAKDAAVGEAEARVRGDLLDQLLSEEADGDQAVLGKAQRLGYDPSLPSLVMVFRVDAERGGQSDGPSRSSERVRRQLESMVRVEMSRRESKSLVASRGSMIVAVVPLQAAPTNKAAREMADTIRQRAEDAMDGCHVAVGVGRPTGGSGLAVSYREAEGALGIGTRVHGLSSTTFFGDLGILRLLAQVSSSADLDSFRRELLGKLEEHDARSGGELVKTLEALFFCQGNLTRTADYLSLHRNSLLYRLQRIEEISGHDMDDPETLLSLQVALKIRHLQEAGRSRQN